MNIKERLKAYNTSLANVEILKNEIELLNLHKELFDEESETLKSSAYDEGMPVHFGNEFHSTVENIAIRREDFVTKSRTLHLKLKEIQENIVVVDAKLRLVDNHERFIIEKKYIENIKYNWEIRDLYKKEFIRYMSDATFARKLNSAIRKMWI